MGEMGIVQQGGLFSTILFLYAVFPILSPELDTHVQLEVGFFGS